jgi:hypothetical protein
MSNSQPDRPASAGRPPARRRHEAGGLHSLVNGALAGVGGVYLATHSVVVTIIAGIFATMLASLTVIRQRQPIRDRQVNQPRPKKSGPAPHARNRSRT